MGGQLRDPVGAAVSTKTYAQLTAQTTVEATDLLASWRSTGPLKKITAALLRTFCQTDIPGTGVAFTQAGTGALETTIQAKAREWISLKDFDGDLNDACAQAVSTGGWLLINDDVTMSGNLSTAANIMPAGGIITVGAHSITLTGAVGNLWKKWLTVAANSVITNSGPTPTSLRWFTNGTADDTIARQIWAEAGNDLYAPAGTYSGTTTTLPHTSSFRLLGDGLGITVFTSLDGEHVFDVDDGAGAALLNYEVGGFTVTGQGSGTGDGYAVHVPAGLLNVAFAFYIHDIFAYQMGGGCVFDEAALFTSMIERVQADGCGGHNFDLNCGSTTILRNAYAHNTVGNAAGYRIRNSVRMENCNGLDIGSGDNKYWGIFGESTSTLAIPAVTGGSYTMPADAQITYAIPYLSKCNIEAYTAIGILSRNGTYIDDGTTSWLGNSSGTMIATWLAGEMPSEGGQIDYVNMGGLLAGTGSFLQSSRVWVLASNTKCLRVIMGASTAVNVAIWGSFDGFASQYSVTTRASLGTLDGSNSFQGQRFGAIKSDYLVIGTRTPASAAAAGAAGQIAWDTSYLYVCTATNTWKRAALSTW